MRGYAAAVVEFPRLPPNKMFTSVLLTFHFAQRRMGATKNRDMVMMTDGRKGEESLFGIYLIHSRVSFRAGSGSGWRAGRATRHPNR